MKLPSMQWYPGDWRKDLAVQSLSFHDRGIWHELLQIMFDSDERGKLVLNGKPMPIEAIARAIGTDVDTLTPALTTLLTYGVCKQDPETGVYYNKRMVEDEEARRLNQNYGKRGGNPALLNQSVKPMVKPPLNPPVKPKPTPSSSSSSSSSTSLNTHTESVSGEDGMLGLKAMEIYAAYPKQESPKPALEAIRAALAKHDGAMLLDKTRLYAAARKGQEARYTPRPAKWFAEERFLEDPATWKEEPKNGKVWNADSHQLHEDIKINIIDIKKRA